MYIIKINDIKTFLLVQVMPQHASMYKNTYVWLHVHAHAHAIFVHMHVYTVSSVRHEVMTNASIHRKHMHEYMGVYRWFCILSSSAIREAITNIDTSHYKSGKQNMFMSICILLYAFFVWVCMHIYVCMQVCLVASACACTHTSVHTCTESSVYKSIYRRQLDVQDFVVYYGYKSICSVQICTGTSVYKSICTRL
jgi:hypothetical protein